jgi:hypothetical protein
VLFGDEIYCERSEARVCGRSLAGVALYAKNTSKRMYSEVADNFRFTELHTGSSSKKMKSRLFSMWSNTNTLCGQECHRGSSTDAVWTQDKQCTYNVTLRRVHESLLPWKSNTYCIFVCVCVHVRVGVQARGRVHARACVQPCLWNIQHVCAIL